MYVRDLLLRGRRSPDDVRPLSAASRSAGDGLTRVVRSSTFPSA